MTLAISIIALGLSCYVWFSQPSKKQLKALKSAEKENNELKTTLANILDENGKVIGKLRLPGVTKEEEEKFINKTPCGALCKHAYWSNKWNDKRWRCEAHLGNICLEARPHFLNKYNQCAMFERKKK